MSQAIDDGIDNNPPLSNIQAEQSILGALIAGSATLADLPPGFESAWFADPVHSAIFRAIAFRTETGEPIDRVTMAHETEDSGVLEEVGGAAYFLQLVEVPVAASEPVDIGYLSSVLAPYSEETDGIVPGAVLEEVGGAGYLVELAERAGVDIAVSARVVRDAWICRELIDMAETIRAAAFDGRGWDALSLAADRVAELAAVKS